MLTKKRTWNASAHIYWDSDREAKVKMCIVFLHCLTQLLITADICQVWVFIFTCCAAPYRLRSLWFNLSVAALSQPELWMSRCRKQAHIYENLLSVCDCEQASFCMNRRALRWGCGWAELDLICELDTGGNVWSFRQLASKTLPAHWIKCAQWMLQ